MADPYESGYAIPTSVPPTDVAGGDQTQQQTALQQTPRMALPAAPQLKRPGMASQILGQGDPVARMIEGETWGEKAGGLISFLRAASAGLAEAYRPYGQNPGAVAAASRNKDVEAQRQMQGQHMANYLTQLNAIAMDDPSRAHEVLQHLNETIAMAGGGLPPEIMPAIQATQTTLMGLKAKDSFRKTIMGLDTSGGKGGPQIEAAKRMFISNPLAEPDQVLGLAKLYQPIESQVMQSHATGDWIQFSKDPETGQVTSKLVNPSDYLPVGADAVKFQNLPANVRAEIAAGSMDPGRLSASALMRGFSRGDLQAAKEMSEYEASAEAKKQSVAEAGDARTQARAMAVATYTANLLKPADKRDLNEAGVSTKGKTTYDDISSEELGAVRSYKAQQKLKEQGAGAIQNSLASGSSVAFTKDGEKIQVGPDNLGDVVGGLSTGDTYRVDKTTAERVVSLSSLAGRVQRYNAIAQTVLARYGQQGQSQTFLQAVKIAAAGGLVTDDDAKFIRDERRELGFQISKATTGTARAVAMGDAAANTLAGPNDSLGSAAMKAAYMHQTLQSIIKGELGVKGFEGFTMLKMAEKGSAGLPGTPGGPAKPVPFAEPLPSGYKLKGGT